MIKCEGITNCYPKYVHSIHTFVRVLWTLRARIPLAFLNDNVFSKSVVADCLRLSVGPQPGAWAVQRFA